MKPSAPTKLVWILGMILGILGIIAYFIPVNCLPSISYWLLLGGFVLLAIGTTFKGV